MAVPDAHGRVVARLMTARRVVVEGVAFFNDSKLGTYLAFGRMDDPGFWYEFSVTWSSLDADRIVSAFTPDDDHYVGECGALGERGVATPTMSLMWFRVVVLIGFDRWPRAIDPPRVLDEEFSLFEADGSRGVRARCLLDAKGRQTLPNLGRSR